MVWQRRAQRREANQVNVAVKRDKENEVCVGCNLESTKLKAKDTIHAMMASFTSSGVSGHLP